MWEYAAEFTRWDSGEGDHCYGHSPGSALRGKSTCVRSPTSRSECLTRDTWASCWIRRRHDRPRSVPHRLHASPSSRSSGNAASTRRPRCRIPYGCVCCRPCIPTAGCPGRRRCHSRPGPCPTEHPHQAGLNVDELKVEATRYQVGSRPPLVRNTPPSIDSSRFPRQRQPPRRPCTPPEPHRPLTARAHVATRGRCARNLSESDRCGTHRPT